jgi:hypothetical protein
MLRKGPSAPTHGWLLGNQVLRYCAYAFLFIMIVFLITVATIRGVVEHDCHNYYKRNIKLFNYWIYVEVGSTKAGCPGP